jgi:hypothetical protein
LFDCSTAALNNIRSRDFGNNRLILAFSLRASIKEEPAMDWADDEKFLEDHLTIPAELWSAKS